MVQDILLMKAHNFNAVRTLILTLTLTLTPNP